MQDRPPTVTVELDVPARMRDGTILRANVYRLAGEGCWPVLLTRLPYGKDPGPISLLDPISAVRCGYVVIVQDTRGTGASDGDFYPCRADADDGFDTIAWAADLPFSDGHVGMYGGSNSGFAQWAAAVQQAPALRAIIPFVTWSDPLNGVYYRGGAFELGQQASWYLMMGRGVLFRRYARDPVRRGLARAAWIAEWDALGATGYGSLPFAEFAPLRRQDLAPSFFDILAAPMERTTDPAASLTVLGKHEQVQTPTLNIGGWYDIFLGDTIANFQAMRSQGKPTRLLIGPWTHTSQGSSIGERSFGFVGQGGDGLMDLGSVQLRWFDHWLKGIDNGVPAEAPIRLFVMGADVWRDEQEWPLARAVDTPWYLRAGGGLSPEPPGVEAADRYDYDPLRPVPTRGGAVLMTQEYPAGPLDQRAIEAHPDVLVYTSMPLERDIEVTGPIAVRLWAVSSAPDTDVVARLTDVFPDGRSFNLTDGIVRARYRHFARGEPPSPIEPGRPYEYEIDLWATSNVFKAGHRMRLQITSSCFPRWDRNPNTGHPFAADAELRVAHQQILHDREHPSHVVLPLVNPA